MERGERTVTECHTEANSRWEIAAEAPMAPAGELDLSRTETCRTDCFVDSNSSNSECGRAHERARKLVFDDRFKDLCGVTDFDATVFMIRPSGCQAELTLANAGSASDRSPIRF